MNMKFFGASATAAMLLTAVPAIAATVIFDDFNINQAAIDDPFPGSTNSNSVPFGAGTRTLTAENTANAGFAISATTLVATGGALSFSNVDQATGRGTLTYTNVGDISNGSNPFFFFDVGVFDNVANFTVTATDTSTNVSTFQEVLQPGFSPFLFFSQFMGSADFNSLATLSFMIDTTNVPGFGPVFSVDGSLNSISLNAVPLPATGLLLFGALGGVAALRRRKARKAA